MPEARPHTGAESAAGGSPSAWSALRAPVFRALWAASILSNIGGWMFDAACGWLMTGLNPSPLAVSLVQAADSLPLFLLALPAGALADVLNRRRLILVLEVATSLACVLLAVLVTVHALTPAVLLSFTALVAALGALESPAMQAIVPTLVARADLPAALAANSLGVNISRVIGPALAGVLLVALGSAAPFWVDAVSNAGVILVIARWCPRVAGQGLPAERLGAAIQAGVRYARHNPALRAALVRTSGFFLFASAFWALLPLLARRQLGGGAPLYGLLLGAVGAGAIAGALLLPRLRRRAGTDRAVRLGQAGTALALFLFAAARGPALAFAACLVAGLSWIAVLASLNVSAQLALPEWVRGRGLALYVTVFFGAMTAGSVLWGAVAARTGLPVALALAGIGALLAIPALRRHRLHSGPAADLTPSMHWPPPVLAAEPAADAGPVLVTVEYHVDAGNRPAFLEALTRLARERRRDGAYAWEVFQDAAHPERMLETFLVDSWLEHLRQHQRVTHADRILEEHVHRLARGRPHVTHYIAAAAAPQPGQT